MKTKFFILLICVCCLSLILGTSENISFSRVEGAFEVVEVSSDQLVDDFALMGMTIYTTREWFSNPDSLVITNGYEEGVGYVTQVTATYYGDEWYDTVYETEYFYFSTERSQEFVNVFIDPLISTTPVPYEGAFADLVNVLQYIAYAVQVFFLILGFVVVVLFDSILVVVTLATFLFRVLGLIP